MPNHIQVLVGFHNTGKTINTIISNGKRFIAYEIVNRLESAKETTVLHQLSLAVTESDKKRGKLTRYLNSHSTGKNAAIIILFSKS